MTYPDISQLTPEQQTYYRDNYPDYYTKMYEQAQRRAAEQQPAQSFWGPVAAAANTTAQTAGAALNAAGSATGNPYVQGTASAVGIYGGAGKLYGGYTDVPRDVTKMVAGAAEVTGGALSAAGSYSGRSGLGTAGAAVSAVGPVVEGGKAAWDAYRTRQAATAAAGSPPDLEAGYGGQQQPTFSSVDYGGRGQSTGSFSDLVPVESNVDPRQTAAAARQSYSTGAQFGDQSNWPAQQYGSQSYSSQSYSSQSSERPYGSQSSGSQRPYQTQTVAPSNNKKKRR
jgi:hypothetical protein